MEQSDEELARLLQSQEYEASQGSSSSTPIAIGGNDDTADDSLALQTDAPFKDLHGLFLAFNDLYFESKLSACEVRWSPRMTVCAGLCVYQSAAHYCSIRLSEPLLKFRPESDYIDTLLHEMIHAYLFVTQEIQDHEGHGADFQHHMNRINKAAGTTITIYHTFHDEVRYYKTHVWKCNGPCQHRPPYYGIVRRSMNRPPQPVDRWYADHQESCGGTYTKISEPEPNPKKKSSSKSTKKTSATARTNDAATTSEPKPKPKPRTMLDNFLIPPPLSKPGTTSSATGSPLAATESSSSSSSTTSPSTTPSASSPSIPALEDQLKETGLRKNVTQDIPSVVESSAGSTKVLSPKEAAAAAALTRYECHLASKNQPPTTSSSTSPSLQSTFQISTTTATSATPTPRTKRKDLDRGLSFDADSNNKDDADSWKKLKAQSDDTKDLIFIRSSSPTATTTADRQKSESKRRSSVVVAMVACPVCSQQVEEATINDHVDLCIWRMSGEA